MTPLIFMLALFSVIASWSRPFSIRALIFLKRAERSIRAFVKASVWVSSEFKACFNYGVEPTEYPRGPEWNEARYSNYPAQSRQVDFTAKTFMFHGPFDVTHAPDSASTRARRQGTGVPGLFSKAPTTNNLAEAM